jgi:putative PIN family toxin of toxin-antitoxin system
MISLRLVFDTNILVSAALNPRGLSRSALLVALSKPARRYLTLAILAEYKAVLSRPELAIRSGLRQQFLQLHRNRAHLFVPSRRLNVTSDADDNIFSECADASRAD